MCIGASGPHFSRDPYRFHQFLSRGAVAERGLGVPLDAIWTLRHMCHCNRYQLLGFCRQRAIGEHLPAECLEGSLRLGSKCPSLFGEFARQWRV